MSKSLQRLARRKLTVIAQSVVHSESNLCAPLEADRESEERLRVVRLLRVVRFPKRGDSDSNLLRSETTLTLQGQESSIHAPRSGGASDHLDFLFGSYSVGDYYGPGPARPPS